MKDDIRIAELADLRERARVVCDATRRMIEDYYDLRFPASAPEAAYPKASLTG